MNKFENYREPYSIAPTVLFSEDGGKTAHEGYILEKSIYAYRIESATYGTYWIAKSNVIIEEK